jgi:phage nucleotide-binding protein
MAIALKRTSDSTNAFVNMIVYAQSGSGKTYAIRTLPNPIVLSAESGLLSLKDTDLPYIEIKSVQDLYDAFEWLESAEAKEYDSVAIDSLSEIAEVVLLAEKEKVNHDMKAYAQMGDIMTRLIRAFRDLPKHVYMTAKAEKSQDEDGKILWAPAMPGSKFAQSIPYFFDEVLALRVEKDDEGNTMRMLQCQSDGKWGAKDRSGMLGEWQQPHLGDVISLIQGGK